MLHSPAGLLSEKTCPKDWYPKTFKFLKAYCSVVLVLTENIAHIQIYISFNCLLHDLKVSNSITESAQACIRLLEKQLNDIDGE